MLNARMLVAVIAGALLGLIVHIVTIFALPYLVASAPHTRVRAQWPVNQMTLLPDGTHAPFAQSDSAFEVAVCPFDLSSGMLKVTAPPSRTYTALSFYSEAGTAFGGLNDRVVGRRRLEMFLATADQRRDLGGVEDGEQIVIVAPSARGFVLLRALRAFPSEAALLREDIETQAGCTSVQDIATE